MIDVMVYMLFGALIITMGGLVVMVVILVIQEVKKLW